MLADAIAKAHLLNEEKLTAGVQVSVQLDPDAELRLEAFNRFCTKYGVRNCPAAPKVVAAFCRAEEKLGTEPRKVSLTLSAIELLHDRHGLANPVATAPVRAQMEKIFQIEPPRSWPKAEQLMFASLPSEIRAVISRREKERETVLRRAQNEAAETKRQAEKPATTSEKEKVENYDNQKTE